MLSHKIYVPVSELEFLPPVGESSVLSIGRPTLTRFLRFLPPVGESSVLRKDDVNEKVTFRFLPPVGESSVLSLITQVGRESGWVSTPCRGIIRAEEMEFNA